MARREDVPVMRLSMGLSAWPAVSIFAFTAAEIGVPLVEIRGGEHLDNLTVEQAERLADGLRLACRVARGEAPPTALDQFLERRGT